jgi:hypothetical protein
MYVTVCYLLSNYCRVDDDVEYLSLHVEARVLTFFYACFVLLLPSVVDKRGTGFSGYTLSSASTSSTSATRSTTGGNTTTGGSAPALSKEAKARQEEMREVRLHQQEMANERHIEAEKQRKQKKDEERARKNQVAQAASAKTTAGDNRLGGESVARGGFNPMMPSSGNTGGYRYVTNRC